MLIKKLMIAMSILSITGCMMGCSSKGTPVASKTNDPQPLSSDEQLLETAFESFNSEDIRGTTTVYTTTYEDGSTMSETENIYYDSLRNIIETSYVSSDELLQKTFLVKEGTNVYCYEKDDSYDGGWVKYLEAADADNETSFDYTIAEFSYSFNSGSGYTDVVISNEGTESINGKDAVKLKVTASFDPSSKDKTEKNSVDTGGTVTRASLIKEFGWSEESIQAVDGFSDLLDDYISYLNDSEASSDKKDDSTEEYLIWIDSDTSCILKLQSSFSVENTSVDNSSTIEDEFWDNCWKVDWIQSDLDDGLTVEEAKEIFELESEYMNEESEYEENLAESDISNNGSYSETVVYVKTFLTGDDCPTVSNLPDSYTETTYEEYYSTFEE